MSTDDVYALIAEILGIPGKYSLETIRACKVHVNRSFRGDDRDALLKTLSALETLALRRARASRRTNAVIPSTESDIILQEIGAILQDTDFLQTKTSLIVRLRALLGEGGFQVSVKDSRETVIRKALAALAKMPVRRQSRIFSTLQREFIGGRGSSLSAWSDIIFK